MNSYDRDKNMATHEVSSFTISQPFEDTFSCAGSVCVLLSLYGEVSSLLMQFISFCEQNLGSVFVYNIQTRMHLYMYRVVYLYTWLI